MKITSTSEYKKDIKFYFQELFCRLSILKLVYKNIRLCCYTLIKFLFSVIMFLFVSVKTYISNTIINIKFYFVGNIFKISVFLILSRILFIKFPELCIFKEYLPLFVDITNSIVFGTLLIKLTFFNDTLIQYKLLRSLKHRFTKTVNIRTFLNAYNTAVDQYGEYIKLNDVNKKYFEDIIVNYINREKSLGEILLGK